MTNNLISHYAPPSDSPLKKRLQATLTANYINITGKISPDALRAFDEFHIGGHAATAHLLDKLHLSAGQSVLDLGAGLGGAARYAAQQYHVHVTGIDLTPAYVAAAQYLSQITGMADHTDFITGDALNLPLADQSFDAIWTIHTGMNIAAKDRFYGEAARTIKQGGYLGLYDVLKHNHNALTYPVPWAGSPAHSHLISLAEQQQTIHQAGFTITEKQDRTAAALTALQKFHAILATQPQKTGAPLVMGDDYMTKITNLIDNINAGCCAVWQIICHKE